jgi:hypothetical protein
MTGMDRKELLPVVREMRGRGLSQKQIARELGMRPAEVAPLLRQVAGSHRQPVADRPLADPAERDLVGCWINLGWSSGRGLDAASDWAASDPEGSQGPLSSGLVGVMVARLDRASRVTVCGYLVDVYCLGVKNTIGPQTIGSSAVAGYASRYFRAFGCTPRSVPLELAQHLVHGAVAYARGLGFEPHPDFASTSAYLGVAAGVCPIRFGRDGNPFFISGPDDDARRVVDTLETRVGAGGYHYVAQL